MKGDATRKQPQTHDRREHRAHHGPPTGPAAIDDAMLHNYLADSLPPEDLARVEKVLRDSAQLRARLEDVRRNREDFQLHTLGAIWHRARLTCPSRQQLGSYLLDALDPELAAYFKFHLEVIECPFCQANLADLEAQSKTSSAPQVSKTRQHRILKSSQHLLGEEGWGT
jgi:anti-sigma factor RsiW